MTIFTKLMSDGSFWRRKNFAYGGINSEFRSSCSTLGSYEALLFYVVILYVSQNGERSGTGEWVMRGADWPRETGVQC